MDNLQQSLVDVEWEQRKHITNEQAAALVRDHAWQFSRYYIGLCHWVRVCEPARDGGQLSSIYYIENREEGGWDLVLDTHPGVTETLVLDKRYDNAMKEQE